MKWEEKIIPWGDIVEVTTNRETVLREYRDWLLGGKHSEWTYWRGQTTGDLILWRR